jgi:hypothetical protein
MAGNIDATAHKASPGVCVCVCVGVCVMDHGRAEARDMNKQINK